jgi:hypothetical protein
MLDGFIQEACLIITLQHFTMLQTILIILVLPENIPGLLTLAHSCSFNTNNGWKVVT